MSQRVIDAKQLDRHFTYDELAKLYQFEPSSNKDPLDKYDVERIKDKILRKLMNEYKDLIVSYREHDSLLIHHDEENLTEVQKQVKNEDKRSKTRLNNYNKASSSTSSQTQKCEKSSYTSEMSKTSHLLPKYGSGHPIPPRNITIKKPQSSTLGSLTTRSPIQSTTHIRIGTHNYKLTEIKTKFNHLSEIDNRPSPSISTKWSTVPDRNNQRCMENTSRMILQSTSSFVPTKIATLGNNSNSSFSSLTNTSSKLTRNAFKNKDKSMSLISSIENVSLIFVRTEEIVYPGHLMTDTRQIYQDKQVTRTYPISTSISHQRQVKEAPITKVMNLTNSRFIIKSSSKQFVDLTKTTNANNDDAKKRAINILKQRLAEKHITPIKGQSLVSADATSSRKRLHSDSNSNLASKRLKIFNSNRHSVDKKHFI